MLLLSPTIAQAVRGASRSLFAAPHAAFRLKPEATLTMSERSSGPKAEVTPTMSESSSG
jgi:hypothetical protein